MSENEEADSSEQLSIITTSHKNVDVVEQRNLVGEKGTDLSSSPESGIGDDKGFSPAAIRCRSMSESCVRGILKNSLNYRPKFAWSLSMSERSGGNSTDYSSQASLADDSELSHDECERLSMSLEHGEALLSFLSKHKSVQFDDKPKLRIYKQNASILGQKKKNEKRKIDRQRRSSTGNLDSSSDNEHVQKAQETFGDFKSSQERPLSINKGGNLAKNEQQLLKKSVLQGIKSFPTIKEQPVAELVAQAPLPENINKGIEAAKERRRQRKMNKSLSASSQCDTTDDECHYARFNLNDTSLEAGELTKSQKKRRKKKALQTAQEIIVRDKSPPKIVHNHRPYDDNYNPDEWTEVVSKSVKKQEKRLSSNRMSYGETDDDDDDDFVENYQLAFDDQEDDGYY